MLSIRYITSCSVFFGSESFFGERRGYVTVIKNHTHNFFTKIVYLKAKTDNYKIK